MEHFNQLTPANAERLALLAEECGEVVQAVGKILRHGYESRHPDGGPTNRERLEREIADVQVAIKLLLNCQAVSAEQIRIHERVKTPLVIQYLHHDI